MKNLICIAMCLLLCACSANEASSSNSEISVSSSEQEISNVAEPQFILISEYTEQIDENNDVFVRYGTIENEPIILGYCHFNGKDKKTEWKKIMAITALSVSLKDCKTINCFINSGDETGILINSQGKLNGNMLPESFRLLANEGLTESETAELAEYSQKIANALMLGIIE